MYALGILGLGIATCVLIVVGFVANRWDAILLLASLVTLAAVLWRYRHDRALLPDEYRSSRRQNYYVALLFVGFGHLSLIALPLGMRDLLGSAPYVPFAGVVLIAMVWAYVIGALFIEVDLFMWRRQRSDERDPHK